MATAGGEAGVVQLRKDLGHEMQKALFPTGGSQQFSIDFEGMVPVSST